jgi:hypothetical protein
MYSKSYLVLRETGSPGGAPVFLFTGGRIPRAPWVSPGGAPVFLFTGGRIPRAPWVASLLRSFEIRVFTSGNVLPRPLGSLRSLGASKFVFSHQGTYSPGTRGVFKTIKCASAL